MSPSPRKSTSRPPHASDTFALDINLADFVPAMVAVYNLQTGRFIYVNKTAKKLLGYSPTEFLTGGVMFASSLIHPDDAERIAQQNMQAVTKIQKTAARSSSPIVSFEYRMRHKKGHYIWLQTDGSVYDHTPDGKVEHIINVSVDITERKQKETELHQLAATLEERIKERSERLELVLQASQMGVWEWDITKNKLVWSDQLKELFGLDQSYTITYPKYVKMLHPDDRAHARQVIATAMKSGEPYAFEHRIIWPDKSVHWIYGMGRAFLKNGKAVRMIGGSINIDHRKNNEKLILKSEERYQAFIRNSQEGIWRIEVEKPIPVNLPPKQQIKRMFAHAYLAEANNAMARMYGFDDAKRMKGLRLGDLVIESDPKNITYLEAFIASGYNLTGVDSHEKDAHDKDRYFRNSLVGIVENGYIVRAWGTQQDVTDAVHAQHRLEESEHRFRTLADSAPVFIWEAGPDKLCTYFNKFWLEFTGRTLKEECGEGWKHSIHPDDLEQCNRIYETAFDAREPFSQEYRLRRHDNTYHWILDAGVPRFSQEGEFLGYVGSCVDIEELKHTRELEEAAALLRQQRSELLKLNKAKDEFISLASHQLRTPATGVKQYVGILPQGYAGTLADDQLRLLQVAYESNERQLNIIDDLLRVAHVDAGKLALQLEKLDLVHLAQDVLVELKTVFTQRNQRIVFKTGKKTVRALADPHRLRMVLENIIDNASKYTPGGKTITVQVERLKDKAAIHVTDRGVGIAKKDMSKLFQKFSRVENPLSTAVGGTGLGLYWAKRVIDLHGGSIEVNSRLHHGTTFSIILPLRAQPKTKL